MKNRNALLLIDLQNDFCKPTGALYVQGAEHDVTRVAHIIRSNWDKIDYISLTQDSHHINDVAHPACWQKRDGSPVTPFTPISLAEVVAGDYVPTIYPLEMRKYVEKLEDNGEFSHFIWPEHCIIGTEGAAIVNEVMDAVKEWERKTHYWFQLVQKGEDPFSEHFGALRANVPNPNNPSTNFNQGLVMALNRYKQVYLAGEARSHCVANTLKQLCDEAPELLTKLFIIEDCMSDVPGLSPAFYTAVDAIYDRARQMGATFVTSAYLKFLN